jgi:hypothetical protein
VSVLYTLYAAVGVSKIAAVGIGCWGQEGMPGQCPADVMRPAARQANQASQECTMRHHCTLAFYVGISIAICLSRA